MAYVGMNRADIESREYLIDANTASSIVGTLLNTGHEVGTAIYQSQVQDLQQRVAAQLKDEENRIYSDQSIAPDQRATELQKSYDAILNKEADVKNRLPGVKDEVNKNLKDRMTSVSDDWKSLDLQEMEQNRKRIEYNTANSYINTQNIQTTFTDDGVIKDKSYQLPEPNGETSEFSEGFIGGGAEGYPDNTEEQKESVLFDAEIHQAVHSGQYTEYELRMMGLKKVSERLFPHDEAAREGFMKEYEAKLRTALPQHDLDLLFTAEFRMDNADEWDYSGFRKKYTESLNNTAYNGKPVPSDEKRALLKTLDEMWTNLQEQMNTSAAAVYDKSISPAIWEMKNAMMANSNKLYTTDDVNKVFAEALEANPELKNFLTPYLTSEITLALRNEYLLNKREYVKLYGIGAENRSEEQSTRLFELEALFPPEDRAAFIEQAKTESSIFYESNQFEKSKIGLMGRLEENDKVAAYIRSGTLPDSKALDEYLEGYRGILTDAQIEAHRSSGQFYLGRDETYLSEAEDAAIKVFNKTNFSDTATVEQVKKIAKDHGIDESSSVYKQMIDIAEKNWDKHLDELAKTSRGFAEKTTEQAVKDSGEDLKKYYAGEKTKSEVLNNLAARASMMTEGAYKDAYSSINEFAAFIKDTNDSKFLEKVWKPYLQEIDTIKQGVSRQRIIDAGLDPLDYANELDIIEDVEYKNEYVENLSVYTDMNMYLHLRERGFDDSAIEDLGFTVPDMSFQNTLRWIEEHPDDEILTAEEYATKLLKESSGKLQSSTLPSGKKLESKMTIESVDESVKKTADKIHERVIEGTKRGARYDKPDAIATLNVRKWYLDKDEYASLAWKFLNSEDITEKTYLEAIKEDLDKLKSPEQQKFKKVVDQFKDYIEYHSKSGEDSDGKSVSYSSYMTDTAMDNFINTCTVEYEQAVESSNGAPVDPDIIAGRVYEKFLNSSYGGMADKFVDMFAVDMTQMGERSFIFFRKETDSYKAYSEFTKGEPLLINMGKFSRLLSDPDPEQGGLSAGVDSGLFGTWMTMVRNDASEKDVSFQIVRDMAKMLGVDVPNLDNMKQDDFNDAIGKLPDVVQIELGQASMVAKMSLDIYRFAQKELDPEMIKSIDPSGNMTPLIENNKMGVKIGDVEFYFQSNGKKEKSYFTYNDIDGNERILTSTTPAINSAIETFEKDLYKKMFIHDRTEKTVLSYMIKKVNGKTEVNIDGIENHLQGVIDRNKASIFESETKLIGAMNGQQFTKNKTSGSEYEQYYGIEYYVDREAIERDAIDGTIFDIPLNSYIKYRFKSTKYDRQVKNITTE